jgi:hypothetical protein
VSLPSLMPRGAGPFVARSALGWQTMLADLSLILFMVSAAAMADGADKPAPVAPAPAPAPAPAIAEPLAVWRDGPGAPGLAAWLAGQAPDARQQLTITLRYNPADQAQALAQGGRLASQAGKVAPRIILEPVAQMQGVEAMAALAYDRP